MRTRARIGFVGLLFAVAALPGCDPAEVNEASINEPALERKVLIATWGTEFKKAVVAKLVEGLQDERVFVQQIDVRNLEAESAKGFQAVIVLDRCHAGRLSEPARQFLAAAPDKSRIVLVPTAGNLNWRPKDAGVDVISAASKIEQAGEVAAAILAKVRALLKEAAGG